MKNFQQTPRQQRRALEASKTRVKNSLKTQPFKVPGQGKKMLAKGVSADTLVDKQAPNAYVSLSYMFPSRNIFFY